MFVIKLTDNSVPEPEYWVYGTTWTVHESEATRFVREANAHQHAVSQGWYRARSAIGSISIEEAKE